MNIRLLPHARLLALGALSLAALQQAPGAMAQSAEPGRAGKMGAELHKRFSAADANGDGKLTREEAKGKMPWVYSHFDAIDAPHAGSVTMQQIAAFAATQRGARQRGE